MEVGRNSYGCENITVYECYKKNNENDKNTGLIKIGSFCGFAENIKIILNWDYNFNRSFTYPFVILKTNELADPFPDRISDIVRTVVIKNDVQVGNNTVIFGGAIIGNGAIILPNSIVVDDIPPYSIVEGSPAKVIKYRYDEILISKLLHLNWWDFPDTIIYKLIHLINDDINLFINCLESIKNEFIIKLAIQHTIGIEKKIIMPVMNYQLIIESTIKSKNDNKESCNICVKNIRQPKQKKIRRTRYIYKL